MDSKNIFKNSIQWGNVTNTVRWNHIFNQKVFSNISFINSIYNFKIVDFSERIKDNKNEFNLTSYNSKINDYNFKVDIDFNPKNNHSIKSGFDIIKHYFKPRNISYSTNEMSALDTNFNQPSLSNIEGAFYVENNIKINKLIINSGLRLSSFFTKERSFFNVEPRLLLKIPLPNSNIFMSYSRMNQYLNQLSNTGVGLPTDLWVPSNGNIRPSRADQVSFGYQKNISKDIELSFESYYKWIFNNINYKEGANFLKIGEIDKSSIFKWEDIITQGRGWAYGNEMMLNKKAGKFTGNASYFISWAIQNDKNLNNGSNFYANNDRRHEFKINGNYSLNKKITLSSNFVYASGNALSVPIATSTTILSDQFQEYGSLNSFTAEAFHRLDLGVQFSKIKKRGERNWEISVYNVYNRKNPYYYKIEPGFNYDQKTTFYTLKRNWLLPILPSISYNFKLK